MAYIEHDLYVALGKLLRASREKTKLTLTEVALSIGVTPMTIQRYEKGDRKINTETIRKLCILYGIDSDALMQSAIDSLMPAGCSSVPPPLQDCSISLSKIETQMLDKFRELNKEGQELLLQRANELIHLGYIKSTQPELDKEA